MENNCSKAIVLAADKGYLMPLSATLKSIFSNGYQGIVYVMNSDIPQEWFEIVNTKLRWGGVKDIKIDSSTLNIGNIRPIYINYMTFARIFCPELVHEEKILYLDTDVIVDHDVNKILDIDLGDHIISAAPDFAYIYELNQYKFNAGILLINSKKWRNEKVTDQILRYAKSLGGSLENADQTLLNDFFEDDYLKLPVKYNFQIGLEREMYYGNSKQGLKEMQKNESAGVVNYHFMSADKPWKLTSSVSKRELWWKYYSLDWDNLDMSKAIKFTIFKKEIFIFTYSDELRDIEVLIKSFPDVRFNIAAYTNMSFKLIRLLQYKNVKLYPDITGKNIDKLTDNSEVMLDITDGPDFEITKKFAKTGKPIIGYREDKFKGVISEDDDYYVLVHSKEEMIEKINELGGINGK